MFHAPRILDRQLGTIGRFGAAVSIFVLMLLFIPNPLEGRLAILALAVTIGVISTLMIMAGTEKKANISVTS